MDDQESTKPVPDNLQPGDRVELVSLGEVALDIRVGDRGTVIYAIPFLMVAFDSGTTLGVLPDLGDAVKRIGPDES